MEEQTISRAVHDADMARMERGKSFVELTEKYDLSLTAVKNIIWKQGDKVLLKASKPG